VRSGGRPWDDDAGISAHRISKFVRALDVRNVNVDELRALAWSGTPACFRTSVWQLLLGYLPLSRERQASSIAKKKAEYQACVAQYFGGRAGGVGKSDAEQALLRQVKVDVPRTNPEVPLFHTDFVQRSLERVLYVWALRHPASGYVQGINDLATPFYAVFLAPWADLDCRDLSGIDPVTLLDVEADVYWCMTKLLDGIQDHYTPSQPGIQRMIFRLRELVHRIDGTCGRWHCRRVCVLVACTPRADDRTSTLHSLAPSALALGPHAQTAPVSRHPVRTLHHAHTAHRGAGGALGVQQRGVPPVRVPLDELPADARAAAAPHGAAVGHVLQRAGRVSTREPLPAGARGDPAPHADADQTTYHDAHAASLT
jgi:hypothetical protein